MHLGVKPQDTSLPAVPWDKQNDTMKVNFPDQLKEVTKRSILGKIANIYDPLGIVSPTTLQGKLFYREAHDARIPWDKELPPELLGKWILWEQNLPKEVEVPRSLPKQGVSSAMYAVTEQPSGTVQNLGSRNCPGCKRFQVKAYADPLTANLPLERTTGSIPFQLMRVNYAGLIRYLSKAKKEKKAYVVLYACSLTKAVYLDLLPDQSRSSYTA